MQYLTDSGRRVFVSITCGVSILQNLIEYARRSGDDDSDSDLSKISEEIGLDVKSHSVREILTRLATCDKLRRASRSSYVFSLALRLLREDPVRFSAELNTLIKLISKLNAENSGVSRVVCQLIASDTASGYFCGRVIERYLTEVGKVCNVPVSVDSLVVIRGLVGNLDKVYEALNVLADKIALRMFRYERTGYDIYTVISGGLKIEVVYISIIASLARSKIVYCPDPESDVLILPPLPVVLEEKLVRHVLSQEVVDEDSAKRYVELGLAEFRNGKLVFRRWIEALVKAKADIGRV